MNERSNLPTIIVGGRGSGKTHRLLQALLEDENATLICASHLSAMGHVEQLVRWLVERGLRKDEARRRATRQVITGRLASQTLQGRTGPIYIDNLRWMLAELLRADPHAITMLADNALVETPQGRRFETEQDNPHT